ncbi:MAG: family 20 glycosylhydrolase [Christensenellales bacterium]|nr:family 20 glycosylhydrolase [Christensenellales bacterium]
MMKTCEALRQRMFALAGCDWTGEVCFKEGEELSLLMDGERLTVEAPDISAAARGLFLAACALRDGKDIPELHQRRHIASCGMMLDMSRGGVMTVEAVKGMIDAHAALGLNLMMLYTEDTYTVPEAPYLGYLRGRYTEKELREMDDYAAESGVELVPCVQTLAHLEQFLQWDVNRDIKDNDCVLMIDEPKTYAWIRAALTALRRCFRTNRIHIGMDEAHGVGLGEYYQKHGAVNRFELLNRHLNRVVDICKELGFKPIMWSDMFYRLGSKNNDYYDTDAVVPESAIAQIPDVALCYWDYYHTDEQFYAGMLEGHRKMGKEVVFAGGIWTWSGILPHVRKTNATMYPALRACLKAGIGTVLATSWGDDGCETDYRLALNQLPIYSEHVWLGEDCTRAEVEHMGERLTGLSEACFNAMGAFYADDDDRRPGKGLFYCDPLYPLTEGLWDLTGYREGLEEGIKTLERHLDDSRCEYAWLAMRIALEKLNWVNELRPAYLRGDKAVVLTMANEKLPAMRELYVKMMSVWREQWESGRKRNGWETICARLGAVIARLDDVQRILLRWVDGTIECVEELDETPLPASRLCGRQDYHTMSFPQFR